MSLFVSAAVVVCLACSEREKKMQNLHIIVTQVIILSIIITKLSERCEVFWLFSDKGEGLWRVIAQCLDYRVSWVMMRWWKFICRWTVNSAAPRDKIQLNNPLTFTSKETSLWSVRQRDMRAENAYRLASCCCRLQNSRRLERYPQSKKCTVDIFRMLRNRRLKEKKK